MHKNLATRKTVMFLFRTIALAAIFGNISFATIVDPRHVNERYAIRAVRQICKAQGTYGANYGAGSFAQSLTSLHQPFELIDFTLATGLKYGYIFDTSAITATSTQIATFKITAMPERYGNKFGKRSFYADTWGQIRGADNGGASPGSETDPVMDDCSDGSIADNERFALYNMQYIRSAQSHYYVVKFGHYGLLHELVVTGRIDPRVGAGFSRGYVYQIGVVYAGSGVPSSYYVNAMPYPYGTAGVRSFYLDQTGVIRGADRNGLASNENDPPITVFP